ncbi:MAG TPA: long-chain fatty acid--CoA ligase, partial [Geminicoccaceae bacterium]|nr:long-chain fatty acid--CoA ligase [Geminicoccaceae bacterium]
MRARQPAADAPWLASYPSGIDWSADFPAMPLWDLFDQAVERYADRPCLDFLGRVWSYRQIGRLVDRAAVGLQALGVGPGTRVGLFLPNCPYFVICFFAVLKAGGTVVSYNPLYAEREIAHQIEDSETDLMVTLDLALLLPKLAPMLTRTRLKAIVVGRMADMLPYPKKLLFPLLKVRELAGVPDDGRHVWFDELIANGGGVSAVPDAWRDVAVLQYTGGTTGVPKGAALTHRNLQVNAQQMVAWHPGVAPGAERVVALLPLFHVFGMTCAMNFALCVGAEIILLPRFDLVQLLRTIERRRATILPGVPTLFRAINHCRAVGRYDLSSLRLGVSGGAPLPLQVKERFEQLSGCPLVEGYGLTECPVVSCNPIGGAGKPGSIGLPLPGTRIEVVSLEDRRTPLGPGERGEICVRGPQVMAGYWNRPAETAAVLDGGRLHTGDIGYMDEEGACFVVDRLKELIICSGFNVYPRVVEEAISGHPDVAEVAVCGVPDGYRGETVKAFVVPRERARLDETALLAFLRDRLSPIEMPKLIEFRDQLPKSAVGKILKRELLDARPAAPAAR